MTWTSEALLLLFPTIDLILHPFEIRLNTEIVALPIVHLSMLLLGMGCGHLGLRGLIKVIGLQGCSSAASMGAGKQSPKASQSQEPKDQDFKRQVELQEHHIGAQTLLFKHFLPLSWLLIRGSS